VSHYADHYIDAEKQALYENFGPDKLPPLTEENLRYNIAMRRKLEHELREIKSALRVIKRAVDR
jgi:hypothetical protein